MSGAAVAGRVAVVTGASSGIGEATARLLAHHGYLCVLVARRREVLQALADEIRAEVEVCDVGEKAEIAATATRILDRHPAVHVLVNGAGFLARGTFVDAPLELVERAMTVNYLGGVRMTRGLHPGLEEAVRRDGRAHVANIASIGGAIVFTPAAPYSASKHAQVAYSRSLRAAFRGSGIDVHTILPGFVTTPGFPHPTFFATRVGRLFVVGPDVVARKLVSALERGTPEVVIPWFPYGLGAIAQAVAPSLTARVLGGAEYPDDA